NVGTVTGQPPCGSAVSASDASWYYGSAPPPQQGQGCTPGHWKNHPPPRPPPGHPTRPSGSGRLSPATPFPGPRSPALPHAVSFQGGPDLDGAAQTLLRAGVSALLNAADPQVNYPRQTQAVISSVNSALASGDRNTMETLASQLDADNNLGCPLN